jgi:glycosyltransferase involved in cell wall biosynthesis
MRVNIIGNHTKDTGVHQDTNILHGILVHVLGKDTEIRHIPHMYPHCPQAEINFFIEVINPSLFPFALKNIWIPNPEWTCKTWQPYARMVDEIWVKTQEALTLFSNWKDQSTTENPVVIKYVGWTSIDKGLSEKKNYNKAIAPTGKNIWRNPKPIVQAYMKIQQTNSHLYMALPELHLCYSRAAIGLPPIPSSVSDKIIIHPEAMPEAEYNALLSECGLSICMSAAEGFGHAVNESMSSGCITILSPIEPFRELTKNAIWVSNAKVTPHPQCLGNLEDIEIDSLVDALAYYCSLPLTTKKGTSNLSREEYENRHSSFILRLYDRIDELALGVTAYSLDDRMPKEDALPNVSVITITKDRRAFIPLAKYSFLAQGYPEEKLEWVIVDDGMDQIKDLVSDLPNVKYILCDKAMTVGAKRNLAVEKATHDVLVMLDDDDVYPNNSLLTRVAMMFAEPKKQCTFSTTIPCFDIHQKKSFMNVPPTVLGMSDRVSEATLCFTRDFWTSRKFPDQQIAEGGAFIRDREYMCREVSPQDVIVSLVHKLNTSSRKAPVGESNGCHYGFSDELFTLVSEIADRL